MFSQGYALLIGVGCYEHAPEHNVPITVADTRALHEVIRDPQFCGYPTEQVTLLHEATATRAGILAALDDLAARTTANDTVLLFYSGHGWDATDGTYYLTAHDTQFTPRSHLAQSKVVLDTGVSEHEFIEKLRAIPAQRVLVIINACYAGSLAPTLGESDPPVLGQPFPEHTSNALLSTGAGRIIMTACREDQVSFIGPGSLTIFARALVDGLRGRGISSRHGYISAFDLYSHLYFAVTDVIEQGRYGRPQEPELTVLKGVGPFAVSLYRGASTLGDFAADHDPAPDTAVRRVSQAQSKAALEVSGDYIDARNSQGFINRPSGTVNQHFGDVHGANPKKRR
ncbi:MAG: hypothetical protein GFH24_608346n2 [Chloroflexi bacterium AL-N5]|nr:hypothetical protein [Chloroflexi bacterium AL-N5]